jgi:hypothetical protein
LVKFPLAAARKPASRSAGISGFRSSAVIISKCYHGNIF